jgi:hypothetical protein
MIMSDPFIFGAQYYCAPTPEPECSPLEIKEEEG